MPNTINPGGFKEVNELPHDAVALMVWREGYGPQPLTLIVSKASWEMNKKVVVNDGCAFNPNRFYEFESPINENGRKTIFQLQGVTGWAANVSTGIVPVKG